MTRSRLPASPRALVGILALTLAGCGGIERQPGDGQPFDGPDGEPYVLRRVGEAGGWVFLANAQGNAVGAGEWAVPHLEPGTFLLSRDSRQTRIVRSGQGEVTYPLGQVLSREDGRLLLLPTAGSETPPGDLWAVQLGPDGAEEARLVATGLKSHRDNRDQVEVCAFGPLLLFHSWLEVPGIQMTIHGLHLVSPAAKLAPLELPLRPVIVDVDPEARPRDRSWRLDPAPRVLGLADPAEKVFQAFLTPDGPMPLPVACDQLRPWGDVDYLRGRVRPQAWLAEREGRLVGLLDRAFRILRWGAVSAEPVEVTYSQVLRKKGLLIQLPGDQWEVLWEDGRSSSVTSGRAAALQVASNEATENFEAPIRAEVIARREREARSRFVAAEGTRLRQRLAQASAALEAGNPAPVRAALQEVDAALAHEVDHRLWVQTLFDWAKGLGGVEGLELLGRLEHDPRGFADVIPYANFEDRRAELRRAVYGQFSASAGGTPAPAAGYGSSGSAQPAPLPAPPRTTGQILAEFFYANRAPGETPYKP